METHVKKKSVFSLLPNELIIKILEFVLDGPEMFQTNIANVDFMMTQSLPALLSPEQTAEIEILNATITIDPSRVRIIDFINTRLFIRLLINVGINYNNSQSKLCDNIKDYIRVYIDEIRYTSRAHDLLDLSESPTESYLIKACAKYLLQKLITTRSTTMDIQFLNGIMTDIPVLTDDTIYTSVKRAIDENRFDEIKYWDVRQVTNMEKLFSGQTKSIDLTFWDTKNVRNMKGLFSYTRHILYGISNWNTCNVRDMAELFRNATSFNEQLNWNTSNVTNMYSMFEDANSFNKTLNWDTSNVTDMRGMFAKAIKFNQQLKWNTSKVIYMDRLFEEATSFNKLLIFDTSQVRYMVDMFFGASLFNQPLEWDTSNVIDMSEMFDMATSFNQPLKWDTSKVQTMSNMFYKAQSFNQSLQFKTGNVIDMSNMFQYAYSFNQPLEGWDTSNVKNMYSMFFEARSFNQALQWDISKVTNMTYIFEKTAGGRFI